MKSEHAKVLGKLEEDLKREHAFEIESVLERLS
jgi:hypothetical protein